LGRTFFLPLYDKASWSIPQKLHKGVGSSGSCLNPALLDLLRASVSMLCSVFASKHKQACQAFHAIGVALKSVHATTNFHGKNNRFTNEYERCVKNLRGHQFFFKLSYACGRLALKEEER
jgi:hypothetical protein